VIRNTNSAVGNRDQIGRSRSRAVDEGAAFRSAMVILFIHISRVAAKVEAPILARRAIRNPQRRSENIPTFRTFPSAAIRRVHNGLGENDQGLGLPVAVYSAAVASYGPLNYLKNAAPHAVHRAWRPIRIGHGNRSVQPKVRVPIRAGRARTDPPTCVRTCASCRSAQGRAPDAGRLVALPFRQSRPTRRRFNGRLNQQAYLEWTSRRDKQGRHVLFMQTESETTWPPESSTLRAFAFYSSPNRRIFHLYCSLTPVLPGSAIY